MLPVALNALPGLLGWLKRQNGHTVIRITANGSMHTFRRIIVGCDGSPEATAAIAFAARVAAACDASLTLASVNTYPVFPVPERWAPRHANPCGGARPSRARRARTTASSLPSRTSLSRGVSEGRPPRAVRSTG